MIRAVGLPPVEHVEIVPTTSEADGLADSSVPLSPNRVQSENSQDLRDEVPVFEVLLDTSGFLMRAQVACLPFPKDLDSYSDPVLGEPVAFGLMHVFSCVYRAGIMV